MGGMSWKYLNVEFAKGIATALGPGWSFVIEPDAHTTNGHLCGPGGEYLFISSSWGPRGMFHVAGRQPKELPYNWETIQRAMHVTHGTGLPEMNASMSKSPEQIAADIKRRILPELTLAIAKIREQYAKDTDYANRQENLKKQVCELFGVEYRADRDSISSHGNIDVQVTSADSMRLYGHCMYLTFDQLKRFKEAVPELFEKE